MMETQFGAVKMREFNNHGIVKADRRWNYHRIQNLSGEDNDTKVPEAVNSVSARFIPKVTQATYWHTTSLSESCLCSQELRLSYVLIHKGPSQVGQVIS